ncbi:MAG TPA: NADH-quinone oxidoreductase subunit B, partial [Solirubrobacteraceae bacterium]|nr:NADH-quinone oxidoreductase subunit B [Solirubrobacteraceae bacterium]
CSSSMGVFNNYSLVPADKFMPVDVHVPGCPPRPEALMHGILRLRKMIQEDPDMAWREGHQAHGTEELVPGDDQETAVNVFRQTPGSAQGA